MHSLVHDFNFVNDFKDAICLRWHRIKHTQGLRTGHNAHATVCPLTVLAPRLTQLIEEVGDGPLDSHRECLRQMVLDLQFIDENGDSVIDEREMEMLERDVNLLVDALEVMRKEARRRGALSHCSATAHSASGASTMFG